MEAKLPIFKFKKFPYDTNQVRKMKKFIMDNYPIDRNAYIPDVKPEITCGEFCIELIRRDMKKQRNAKTLKEKT